MSESRAGDAQVLSSQLLAGLTVVQIAGAPSLARSLTSKLFADLGAEVVLAQIDPPTATASTPTASDLEWQHLQGMLVEGIRTISPVFPGRDVLDDRDVSELIRRADIVLAPPPNEVARFGLTYDAVKAINPDIVFSTLSAFGDEPGSDGWRPSELVLQAMGGMLRTTGQPGEPPTKIGGRVAEHLGALYLAIGSMTGLIRRNRTGGGAEVSVSLVDSLASSLNNFVAEYKGKGHLPEPLGNRHLASSPWNAYRAADGYVVICLITDRQWDELASLMGYADLVGNPDFHGQHNRRPRADEIDKMVTAWTESRTVQDILTALSGREIPCGDIARTDQVLADDTLYRRGLLTRKPGGAIGLGPLVRIVESVFAEAAGIAVDQRFDQAVINDGDARPLDGLRVVEIGVAAAGPVCGRILANLGADVIKIEPAGGEIGRRVPPTIGTTSAVFHLNGNDKRSLCVDLRSDPGTTIARRVINTADIVVENMAPGRLDSWGLGFEEFAKSRPGLIYTSVTGFGQGSAGTRVRAYDTVVQAASGLLSLTGFPDGIPTKAGISLSDFFGGVSGAFATLVALSARQLRRSEGKPAVSVHLDVAMYDVTVWTTMSSWPQFLLNQETPGRIGNLDRYAFWQGLLTCQDGQLALTLHTHADADRLRELVGPPAPESGDDLQTGLDEWAAGLTVPAAVAALRSVSLAAGPVRSVIDLINDDGIKSRAVITTSMHAVDGEVPVMSVPIGLSGMRVRIPEPAPILGGDTRTILSTVADFSDAEVEKLLAHPTVKQA